MYNEPMEKKGKNSVTISANQALILSPHPTSVLFRAGRTVIEFTHCVQPQLVLREQEFRTQLQFMCQIEGINETSELLVKKPQSKRTIVTFVCLLTSVPYVSILALKEPNCVFAGEKLSLMKCLLFLFPMSTKRYTLPVGKSQPEESRLVRQKK